MSRLSNDLHDSRRAVRICVLLALVLIGIGISRIGSEPPSSFARGIPGMAYELLYTSFGDAGRCAFWIILAMLPLGFARWLWRHTIRRPNDRWYRN